MANLNRNSKERPAPFVPSDFMVDWAKRLEDEPDEERDGMTSEEILSAFDKLIELQEGVKSGKRIRINGGA